MECACQHYLICKHFTFYPQIALVVSCVHDSLVLDTPQVHTAVILKIITLELVRLGVGHEDLN